jgi:hypothetical protein
MNSPPKALVVVLSFILSTILVALALAIDPVVLMACVNLLSGICGWSWHIPFTWLAGISVFGILTVFRGWSYSSLTSDDE